MNSTIIRILNSIHSNAYRVVSHKRGKELKTGLPNVNFKRMAKGNSKLDKVLIFDTLSGKNGTCSQDCQGCYAKKAEVQYFNTELYRTVNTFLAQYHMSVLNVLLRKQLETTKNIRTVRIHSSGDFFSQEYLNMWTSIVKDFPEYQFYAYTKESDKLDFSEIEALSNFNKLDSFASLDGKKVLNYGDKNHVAKLIEAGYFLCPATVKENKEMKCNRECKYCITHNKVCFNEH